MQAIPHKIFVVIIIFFRLKLSAITPPNKLNRTPRYRRPYQLASLFGSLQVPLQIHERYLIFP